MSIEYTLDRLRKMATCVYAATDKPVADDLSGGFLWAIERIEKLEADLKLWRPLTPEEAQKAYDEAEAVPVSEEEIQRIVAFATDPANRCTNNEQMQLAAALKKARKQLFIAHARAEAMESRADEFGAELTKYLEEVGKLREIVRTHHETM